MCGYEMYIYTKKLQRKWTSWRVRHSCNKYHYIYVVFSNNESVHSNLKDAIDNMMCTKSSDSTVPR